MTEDSYGGFYNLTAILASSYVTRVYAAILRTVPTTDYVQQQWFAFDGNLISADSWENQLLDQAAGSTIPALTVYGTFFGVSPGSAGLDYLTQYAGSLAAQGFSLQNVYVNLAASFIISGPLAAHYAAESRSDFLTEAYVNVFGTGPSQGAEDYLLSQFDFFKDYTGSELGARGAIYGTLLSISDATPSGRFVGAEREFLKGLANGNGDYGSITYPVQGALTVNLPPQVGFTAAPSGSLSDASSVVNVFDYTDPSDIPPSASESLPPDIPIVIVSGAVFDPGAGTANHSIQFLDGGAGDRVVLHTGSTDYISGFDPEIATPAVFDFSALFAEAHIAPDIATIGNFVQLLDVYNMTDQTQTVSIVFDPTGTWKTGGSLVAVLTGLKDGAPTLDTLIAHHSIQI